MIKINKENFMVNNTYKLQKILRNKKLTKHELAFIGAFSPFLQKPNNDIMINNQYLTLKQIGTFINISKNVITNTIKKLENADLIRVVKGGNTPPIIYFNPGIFYTNIETSQETYELFKIPIEKFRNKKSFEEKELEHMIIKDINLVEEGLTLIENQYKVDDGFIDILAKDKNNKLCIIELKVVSNCKDIVFQCVYYPTQFEENVRMITIAPDYSNKVAKSLKALEYVEMKTYQLNDGKLQIHNY